MFDYSLLRGKIVTVYGSQLKFSEAIGAFPSRVSAILNCSAYPDQSEIIKWSDALGITRDEIGSYFFNLKSHKCEEV